MKTRIMLQIIGGLLLVAGTALFILSAGVLKENPWFALGYAVIPFTSGTYLLHIANKRK